MAKYPFSARAFVTYRALGTAAELAPKRPLLSRKYGTFAERQAAEKAKRAAAQARFQTRKNALTIHLVSDR